MFAHHERPDRADVNDTKLRQLFGDGSRLTSIRPTDVHGAKKYHPAHLNDLTIENKKDAEKKKS